jgi:DNA-binding transcriptional ArsR family regulator
MFNQMVKHEGALDAVFSALSDPIRRQIVERLTRGELTAGEIAAGFSVSQPAISKHLKVLERSGLLKRTIVGREHRCRLAPHAIRTAAEWLDMQERFWSQTFDRLDAYLSRTTEEEETR